MSEMLDQTLADLGVGYLDLYLLHWPIPMVRGATPGAPAEKCADGSIRVAPEVDLVRVWHSMEALVDGGRVRRIGLCNTPAALLMFVLANCRVRPYLNQFERNPACPARALAAYCRAHGVRVTAYSPLGSRDSARPDWPVLLENEHLVRVARKHDTTPAAVCIAWSLARADGMHSIIPKSVTPERIAANLAAADLVLDDDDMHEIEQVHHETPFRYCDPAIIFGIPLFD